MRVLNSLSEMNLSRILRLIWQEKKISRVDIAAVLGMDKSTVTKITSDLTQRGLVVETESGESGPMGGRKPVFLEINANRACAGGMEITPEKMHLCLVSLTAGILFEKNLDIEEGEFEIKGLEGCFKRGLNILQKQAERLSIPLAAVGVGLPGIVDADSGTIIQSMPLCITEASEFASWASKTAGLPVFIENDARCCCYSERMTGQRFDSEKNSMYVMVELRKQSPKPQAPNVISVGLGLVMNGKVYHGANAFAGEFRSMLWDGSNSTQFKSDNSFVENLADRSKVQPVFRELAKNIAFMVNTLALDVVYVGGLEKKYTDDIVKYIQEEIVFLWPYQWHKTAVVTSASIADMAVSFGAASMVLDKLFCVPEINPSATVIQAQDRILLHLPL